MRGSAVRVRLAAKSLTILWGFLFWTEEKAMRWWWVLRWGLVLLLSLGGGVVGMVVGLYVGLYMRTLLGGLLLAWVGFTAAAYFTFLFSGFLLRLPTARYALAANAD
jgi:hypothetical protein